MDKGTHYYSNELFTNLFSFNYFSYELVKYKINKLKYVFDLFILLHKCIVICFTNDRGLSILRFINFILFTLIEFIFIIPLTIFIIYCRLMYKTNELAIDYEVFFRIHCLYLIRIGIMYIFYIMVSWILFIYTIYLK
jgi:hypothetical protein